jgi:polynucleotide 5'-hydroxyl-kinase GRC3/NOL9
MVNITLPAGKTLLVSGPASLTLIEGEVAVLGAPVEKEDKLLIREEKQIPIEAVTDAALSTSLGTNASLTEVEGSTIPNSWRSLAEAALEAAFPKIIAIGDVDSGKSTLCTYLANMLLNKYTRVSVIDADVGQSDIGPPTSIGLGVTDGYILSLADIDPASMFFVGHTSPAPVQDKVILGIRKLMELSSINNSPIIINTDGWVADREACQFKASMINEISPDLVAVIQSEREIDPIMDAASSPVIRVQSPAAIRKRTRDERRRLRELSYRRYLANAVTRQINFDKVELRGAQVRNGRLLAATQKLRSIVGFLDEKNLLSGIGILKGVEQKAKVLRIYTPMRRPVEVIEFGSVKLTDDGKEIQNTP